MCNLYTYKRSRDEVRGLLQHYKLIGVERVEQFSKEMRGKNDEALVYPNYLAPVVIEQNGQRALEHPRWGMPETLSGSRAPIEGYGRIFSPGLPASWM